MKYYVVDAFTARRFAGNPAAVVPLEAWPSDALMQQVAAELNLSETAFVGPDSQGGLRIRWFTPAVEVDLCGHATLAAAHVITTELEPGRAHVRFASQSGPLEVRRDGALLVLDFPARPPRPLDDPRLISRLSVALGRAPREVLISRDLVAIYDDPEIVRTLTPDFGALATIDPPCVIVTAPSRDEDADFVSRFFAPAIGIPEDPVTGSAHCTLIPLWAGRLGKRQLYARQLSRRGGDLTCALRGDRVDIGGHAVLVATGTLVTQ